MHITEGEEGYSGKGCNSVHAEINAIKALPDKDLRGLTAIIIGHDFACEPCKEALYAVGVDTITVLNP